MMMILKLWSLANTQMLPQLSQCTLDLPPWMTHGHLKLNMPHVELLTPNLPLCSALPSQLLMLNSLTLHVNSAASSKYMQNLMTTHHFRHYHPGQVTIVSHWIITEAC